jgi:hypothetical protein
MPSAVRFLEGISLARSGVGWPIIDREIYICYQLYRHRQGRARVAT